MLDKAIAGLDEIAHSTEAARRPAGRAVAHQAGRYLPRDRPHGRRPQAISFARQLAENLAAASPRDLAVADCLARTFAGLGELSLDAGQTGEAVEHLGGWSRLLNRPPRSILTAARRGAQLEAYFRLGRALGFDHNLRDAEFWFQKMHDLAERSGAFEPGNHQTHDLLAISYRKLGDVRKLTGNLAAARADYVKAVNLGRQVVKAEPANLEFKIHLGLALDDLAMTLHGWAGCPRPDRPSSRPSSFSPS